MLGYCWRLVNLQLTLGLISYYDVETRFAFHFLIPQALAGFVCYGLLPLLFHKIGLAQRSDLLEVDEEAVKDL